MISHYHSSINVRAVLDCVNTTRNFLKNGAIHNLKWYVYPSLRSEIAY